MPAAVCPHTLHQFRDWSLPIATRIVSIRSILADGRIQPPPDVVVAMHCCTFSSMTAEVCLAGGFLCARIRLIWRHNEYSANGRRECLCTFRCQATWQYQKARQGRGPTRHSDLKQVPFVKQHNLFTFHRQPVVSLGCPNTSCNALLKRTCFDAN